MPDSSVEAHDGRAEGIFGGDLDVDDVLASLVGGARRPRDAGLEVCQITAAVDRLGRDVGVGGIGSHITQLLGYTADPTRRHDGRMCEPIRPAAVSRLCIFVSSCLRVLVRSIVRSMGTVRHWKAELSLSRVAAPFVLVRVIQPAAQRGIFVDGGDEG